MREVKVTCVKFVLTVFCLSSPICDYLSLFLVITILILISHMSLSSTLQKEAEHSYQTQQNPTTRRHIGYENTICSALYDIYTNLYSTLIILIFLFLLSQQPPPPVGQGLPIHEVSRLHTTTHHSRQDCSGRVISPSQRPTTDNTQHSQQTNIHAPGGIRKHTLSRRAAEDLRFRPRGH